MFQQLADLQAVASVISAICAVVAAGVSLMVWRKARSNDLADRIDDGDKAIRKHADRSMGEIKSRLDAQTERIGELEETMARIVQQSAHTLTARDLGSVHDKINRVAEQVAASTALTQAMREQLRVIQEHLMRGERK